MKESTANAWLTLFRTRPAWGLIPVRVIFAFVLISSALRILPTDDPWAQASAVFDLCVAALMLPGFLARAVGLLMTIKIAATLYFDLPIDLGRHVETQVLMFAIAFLLFVSGAGRYSVDHRIAVKVLKMCSIKKWELYCLAEIPHARWWE